MTKAVQDFVPLMHVNGKIKPFICRTVTAIEDTRTDLGVVSIDFVAGFLKTKGYENIIVF
jgi:hypothetical protein